MSQISIQDIAAGIDRRFWSPRRLNALFMSQVMKDGETMRNLIHGGDRAASDAVLQALIALKNNLIAQGRYTDAVDDVLIKFTKARKKKMTVQYI